MNANTVTVQAQGTHDDNHEGKSDVRHANKPHEAGKAAVDDEAQCRQEGDAQPTHHMNFAPRDDSLDATGDSGQSGCPASQHQGVHSKPDSTPEYGVALCAQPSPSLAPSSAVPKPRYRFLNAPPFAQEESDTCREAFEHWSVHQCPALEPPREALLDVERDLIYGVDRSSATKAAGSTAEACARSRREPRIGCGPVASPDLWLYLATRGNARRHKKSAATTLARKSSPRPDNGPTRKSARVKSASASAIMKEDLSRNESSTIERNKQERNHILNSSNSVSPYSSRTSVREAVEAIAEREVAVLLSELESVVLACAAESSQACVWRGRRKKHIFATSVECELESDADGDARTTSDARIARLRSARDERVAALRLLSRVDASVRELLGRDEHEERQRLRSALSRINEAEIVARQLRKDEDPDEERYFAADDAIRTMRRAADDVSFAHFAL